MSRKLSFVLAFLTVLMVSGVVVLGARAQANAGAHLTGGMAAQSADKTAEQQFKNIQVLKGVPSDQLIPTMQFITASLGVECDFCHVQGAFEKDDKKPKQTARKMMEMMFAINADNFDRHREVTCYTCHRGNSKPVDMPPVMTMAEAKAPMAESKPEESERKFRSTGRSTDRKICAGRWRRRGDRQSHQPRHEGQNRIRRQVVFYRHLL